MDGYKSIGAWQLASELCIKTLEATDVEASRGKRAVLEQLARAVVSADINIVEGYALGTVPLFRRHLRIALGSAAESERLLVIAEKRGYIDRETSRALQDLANKTLRALYGLVRSHKLVVLR